MKIYFDFSNENLRLSHKPDQMSYNLRDRGKVSYFETHGDMINWLIDEGYMDGDVAVDVESKGASSAKIKKSASVGTLGTDGNNWDGDFIVTGDAEVGSSADSDFEPLSETEESEDDQWSTDEYAPLPHEVYFDTQETMLDHQESGLFHLQRAAQELDVTEQSCSSEEKFLQEMQAKKVERVLKAELKRETLRKLKTQLQRINARLQELDQAHAMERKKTRRA